MLNHTDLDSQLKELLAAPRWYVGFSGGLDSTVLLHLLHHWCAVHPSSPPLGAIHINHAMQSAAPHWQGHCEGVCRTLELPLITRTVAVGSEASAEAAARNARYRAFEELLPPDAVLFLGHHLDDQVETFFLRLLRGAGVEGLAAMPRKRPLGKGQLARPLLDCSRSEIEQYAAHYCLAHVEDPSNSNTAMDRNFLRAELLPRLASRWPSYRQSVARASGHLAAAANTLAREWGVPETLHSELGDPGLALALLTRETEQLAATRLRAWLRAGGYQAPDHAALSEFLRQLRTTAADATPRLTCGGYCLQRYREAVFLLPEWDGPAPGKACDLSPGVSREISGVGRVSLRRAGGDGLWLAPGEQLTVRWRQGGERCCLAGRSGSRSLKTLLQEWNVPPWWRDRVPLFYLGGELLAVGDFARCASARWKAVPPEGQHLWQIHWERPLSASSD